MLSASPQTFIVYQHSVAVFRIIHPSILCCRSSFWNCWTEYKLEMSQPLLICRRFLPYPSTTFFHIDYRIFSAINKLSCKSVTSNFCVTHKKSLSSMVKGKDRSKDCQWSSGELIHNSNNLLQRQFLKHVTSRACSVKSDNSKINDDNRATTHFGYETVPEDEKVEKGTHVSVCVLEMFC